MARTIILLSDIHANILAFEKVLEDIRSKFKPEDELYSLGDLVGYGPNPLECLRLAKRTFKVALLGNHDSAAIFDPSGFNDTALQAIMWTRDQIERARDQDELFEYLGEQSSRRQENSILFVHGSPSNPMNEYVFPEDIHTERKMTRVFSGFQKACFAGHTHLPGVFTSIGTNEAPKFEFRTPDEVDGSFTLAPDKKAFFNVGSVGQPRDGDKNACYCVAKCADDGSICVSWIRVPYDNEACAKRIEKIPQLSPSLAVRILRGS